MKTLVFLAGALSDDYVWAAQKVAFSGEHAVHCPHVHDHDSLEDMAQAVLDAVPGAFALVGASLGGRVALEVYRRAPERVERLALIAAGISAIDPGEPARRQDGVDKARAMGMEVVAKAYMPRMIHPSFHDNEEFMAGIIAMACRFTPDGLAREAQTLLKRPDQEPVLAAITCPTLIMAGTDDALTPLDRTKAIAAAIDGSKTILIDGAAHFPMLEQPEAVNAALREWLSAESQVAN
jgi:pimeloyl-ACP methyl ester carboxylesterase